MKKYLDVILEEMEQVGKQFTKKNEYLFHHDIIEGHVNDAPAMIFEFSIRATGNRETGMYYGWATTDQMKKKNHEWTARVERKTGITLYKIKDKVIVGEEKIT